MLAIYDFIPNFCPNCGRDAGLDGYAPCFITAGKHYRRDADYNALAAHSCECYLVFQKADTQAILDAAENSGGDMKQYR